MMLHKDGKILDIILMPSDWKSVRMDPKKFISINLESVKLLFPDEKEDVKEIRVRYMRHPIRNARQVDHMPEVEDSLPTGQAKPS